MSHPLSRRRLLQSSAAAGMMSFLYTPLRAQEDSRSPSEKINIAMIGADGKGLDDTRRMNEAGANIVALCDIDDRRLANALKVAPKAATYTDFRRLLERERGIDAVVITTPDHMHAYIALMAMDQGKHVYCEKPLAHSIYESRAMQRVAREKKLATQMGNGGHSSEGLRMTVEWIQAGVIGPVREVHVWSDRPIGYWPQGQSRPPGEDPIPEKLDWDLYLGPAPMRPFKSEYPKDGDWPRGRVYHPFVWRGWVDFGTGALGDMSCHIFDAPVWALKLAHPISVEAEHSGFNGETYPKWSIITYHFPARGELPPVKMTWYDGGKMPPRPPELEADRTLPKNGMIFIGEKGTILAPQAQAPRVIPESKMQEIKRPEPFIPRVPGGNVGHQKEWLSAIRGNGVAGSNFEYAGPLTEVVLIGNLALHAGKKVEWDGPAMRATNAPELSKIIKPPFRKGWEM